MCLGRRPINLNQPRFQSEKNILLIMEALIMEVCCLFKGGDPFEGDPVFPLSPFFHLVSSEKHIHSLYNTHIPEAMFEKIFDKRLPFSFFFHLLVTCFQKRFFWRGGGEVKTAGAKRPERTSLLLSPVDYGEYVCVLQYISTTAAI